MEKSDFSARLQALQRNLDLQGGDSAGIDDPQYPSTRDPFLRATQETISSGLEYKQLVENHRNSRSANVSMASPARSRLSTSRAPSPAEASGIIDLARQLESTETNYAVARGQVASLQAKLAPQEAALSQISQIVATARPGRGVASSPAAIVGSVEALAAECVKLRGVEGDLRDEVHSLRSEVFQTSSIAGDVQGLMKSLKALSARNTTLSAEVDRQTRAAAAANGFRRERDEAVAALELVVEAASGADPQLSASSASLSRTQDPDALAPTASEILNMATSAARSAVVSRQRVETLSATLVAVSDEKENVKAELAEAKAALIETASRLSVSETNTADSVEARAAQMQLLSEALNDLRGELDATSMAATEEINDLVRSRGEAVRALELVAGEAGVEVTERHAEAPPSDEDVALLGRSGQKAAADLVKANAGLTENIEELQSRVETLIATNDNLQDGLNDATEVITLSQEKFNEYQEQVEQLNEVRVTSEQIIMRQTELISELRSGLTKALEKPETQEQGIQVESGPTPEQVSGLVDEMDATEEKLDSTTEELEAALNALSLAQEESELLVEKVNLQSQALEERETHLLNLTKDVEAYMSGNAATLAEMKASVIKEVEEREEEREELNSRYLARMQFFLVREKTLTEAFMRACNDIRGFGEEIMQVSNNASEEPAFAEVSTTVIGVADGISAILSEVAEDGIDHECVLKMIEIIPGILTCGQELLFAHHESVLSHYETVVDKDSEINGREGEVVKREAAVEERLDMLNSIQQKLADTESDFDTQRMKLFGRVEALAGREELVSKREASVASKEAEQNSRTADVEAHQASVEAATEQQLAETEMELTRLAETRAIHNENRESLICLQEEVEEAIARIHAGEAALDERERVLADERFEAAEEDRKARKAIEQANLRVEQRQRLLENRETTCEAREESVARQQASMDDMAAEMAERERSVMERDVAVSRRDSGLTTPATPRSRRTSMLMNQSASMLRDSYYAEADEEVAESRYEEDDEQQNVLEQSALLAASTDTPPSPVILANQNLETPSIPAPSEAAVEEEESSRATSGPNGLPLPTMDLNVSTSEESPFTHSAPTPTLNGEGVATAESLEGGEEDLIPAPSPEADGEQQEEEETPAAGDDDQLTQDEIVEMYQVLRSREESLETSFAQCQDISESLAMKVQDLDSREEQLTSVARTLIERSQALEQEQEAVDAQKANLESALDETTKTLTDTYKSLQGREAALAAREERITELEKSFVEKFDQVD